MKKIFRRLLLVILVLAASFAAFLRANWSKSAPVYTASAASLATPLVPRMRTPEEHDRIVEKYGKPYVFEAARGNGRLVFFGIQHTKDRNDPQLADIETRWAALKPTVALYEGRSRGFFVGPAWGLDGVSEAGFVHKLARRDGVRMLSLEPSYENEVAALLRTFTPEQLALYFFTRVYWGETGGKSDDALALDLLAKRSDVNGLRGVLPDLAAVDRVWKREYPSLGDWRTYTGGEPEGSWLAAISADSRRFRGEHMAHILLELTSKGERVFAVVGSGHVIRLEWILRNAFGMPHAEDQPA